MKSFVATICILIFCSTLHAEEVINVWPDLAPGETSRSTGEVSPPRKNEPKHPITRLINIRKPTMVVYPAKKPNGTAAVILPGGGFGKVVPDLEGSEAALWLNEIGITCFVVNYRTKRDDKDPGWQIALQDSQRAVKYVRAHADKWKLKRDRIGLVAFSAGGQVGARHLSAEETAVYKPVDDIDKTTHRPDFAILIYPWRMYDENTKALVSGIKPPKTCPPCFLVHTDDDRSSSLGAVYFYAGLKKHGIPSGLHVYHNGGHGYGLRDIKGSQISTWPSHAGHWLVNKGFGTSK